MATKIDEIKSVNWQLSMATPGQVVSGIDDIRQCIRIILTTSKLSDPLRPLFGSNIWRFIDSPTNTAVGNIAAEILDCVGKWEPRIVIKKLLYDIVGSRINFYMTVTLLESGAVTEILFYIDGVGQIEIPTIGRNFSNGFDFGFN